MAAAIGRPDSARLLSARLLTARLTLRRWRAEDQLAMVAINEDPEVTRYLYRTVDPAAAAFYQRVTAHWDEHGFGLWAVQSREGELAGALIGFVGVAYPAFLPELATRPELGWRLARAVWGRGLATEAAIAARDDALHRLGLRELISIIHPDNGRSQRVAAKLGMTLERLVYNPGIGREAEVWKSG
jgi:RimJ/RimL family protein N-acetyltransferase